MPDAADIPRRLAELAALSPGWVNGEGRPLPEGAVPWLCEWLQARAAEGMPVPYLYLTVEGELEAEWDVGRLGCEMTMGPESRRAKFWDFDAVATGELDMTDPAAVAEWVAGWRERVRRPEVASA